MNAILDKAKGGANSKWVAIRCQEPVFWRFLSLHFGTKVTTEDEAIKVVYIHGGVESRAEFDTTPDAANRFHNVLRRPFADFMARAA